MELSTDWHTLQCNNRAHYAVTTDSINRQLNLHIHQLNLHIHVLTAALPEAGVWQQHTFSSCTVRLRLTLNFSAKTTDRQTDNAKKCKINRSHFQLYTAVRTSFIIFTVDSQCIFCMLCLRLIYLINSLWPWMSVHGVLKCHLTYVTWHLPLGGSLSIQESLADAKVCARQQCVYEDP